MCVLILNVPCSTLSALAVDVNLWHSFVMLQKGNVMNNTKLD